MLLADALLRPAARPLILVAGALLAFASSAGAQGCLGRPVGGLASRALIAQAAHVRYDADGGSRGTDLGAEYWANPRGFGAYSVGYSRRIMTGDDPHVAHLQLVAELPTAGALPPGAGLCLTTGVSGSWYDAPEQGGARRSYSVPLGVAAGFLIPAGPMARLYPYVAPQLVFTETTGGTVPTAAEPSSYATIEVGLGFARATLVARTRLSVALSGVGTSRPPFPDLRAGVEMGVRF